MWCSKKTGSTIPGGKKHKGRAKGSPEEQVEGMFKRGNTGRVANSHPRKNTGAKKNLKGTAAKKIRTPFAQGGG